MQAWRRILDPRTTEALALVLALLLAVGTAVVAPERYGDGDWRRADGRPLLTFLPAPSAAVAVVPPVAAPVVPEPEAAPAPQAESTAPVPAWGQDPWEAEGPAADEAPAAEDAPPPTVATDPWARLRAQRLSQ